MSTDGAGGWVAASNSLIGLHPNLYRCKAIKTVIRWTGANGLLI
jgi:hypothetical protein